MICELYLNKDVIKKKNSQDNVIHSTTKVG